MSKPQIIFSRTMFLLLFILMITLSGCSKQKVTCYDNETLFINLLEDYQTGRKTNGAVIDLRSYEDYQKGHIRNAKSFDFYLNDKETFIEWMLTNFDKNTTVLLFDGGNEEYKTVLTWLENSLFSSILVYTKGYQTLKSHPNFEQKIYETTGDDPCGC